MNNINNDINRFDGKYLKCVVSKYDSVLKYLANSGAMVVLQPSGDEGTYKDITYQRNYIYLGNEFLASGYGFLCKDMRIKAESIVAQYDNDIENLKKADAAEAKVRKETDDDIYKKLNNYVAINGGRIDKTVFNLNGITIPTRDIILYGEEAQYTDFTVDDIKISINSNDWINNNNVACHQCVDIHENKDNLFHNISLNKIVYLPIGSQIKDINCEITANDNDSGGLNRLAILHNFNNEYVATVVYYDFDAETYIEDPFENDKEDSEKIFTLHKYIYSKSFTNNENSNDVLIVDTTINNIIKGIKMVIAPTPKIKYKYYPALYQKNNEYKIISSGNAIKEHQLDLNIKVDVKPQYYIMWGYNIESLDLINNYEGLNDADINTQTEINIRIERDHNRIYFGVPSNFIIQTLYLKTKSEKYNVTGMCKLISNASKIKCPMSQEFEVTTIINNSESQTQYNKCRINYNFYEFDYDELENDVVDIELNINYLNIDNKIDTVNSNVLDAVNWLQEPKYLNNEIFDNLYWISGKDSSYLEYKMNNVNKNGIQKQINS